jgi:hypothetical protein
MRGAIAQRNQQLRDAASHRLVISPAKDALRLRIPLRDETLLIHRHHRIERGIDDQACARFAFTQGLVRLFAIGQVEHKGHALIRPSLEARGTDQDRHAAAVFPEILLLIRLGSSGRLQLSHAAVVCIAPFGRRQFPPTQSTRGEIVAIVSHDTKKGFVSLYNLTVKLPDEDPHDVGVD